MMPERQTQCQADEPRPPRRRGCGCLNLLAPCGLVFIVLGVPFLVAWHYGNYDILEFARGARIEPAIDFSRPGIHKRQFSDTSVPRMSLNLCFCEEYGPDAPPPSDVWRRLRFDVSIKDSEGTVLISSEYRGDGVLEPVRGLQVVYMFQKIRPEMADRLHNDTLQIEVDNLSAVEEMREVTAALYFAQTPWERGGMAQHFNNLLLFFPGVLLLTLGTVQLTIWASLARAARRRNCEMRRGTHRDARTST